MNKDVFGGVATTQKPSGGKSSGGAQEELFDVRSEGDSQHLMDDVRNHNEVIRPLDIGQNIIEGAETLGFPDADYEESLMDIPDDALSVETENDATTERPKLTQLTQLTRPVKKLEK